MSNDKKSKIIGLDASGDAITEERVMKHMPLIKKCILIMFPKAYCREAVSSFECLTQMGVISVIKCLYKFNSYDALNKVTADPTRKRKKDADHLRYKQENPEQALIELESAWVKKRLLSDFRRHRWDNSEKALGGASVPYDWNKIQADCQAAEMSDKNEAFSFGWKREGVEISMRDFGESQPVLGINVAQVQADMDEMVRIEASHGQTKALEFFASLPKQRKEDFEEFYMKHNEDRESLNNSVISEVIKSQEERHSVGIELSGGASGGSTDSFDSDDEHEGFDS